jgi:hypothetical protein
MAPMGAEQAATRLAAGAPRHAGGFLAAGRTNAVRVGSKRRPLRLLDATEDTPPFTLSAFDPLLLGDGLGPLAGLFVHTVSHGVLSNTPRRGQRRRAS